VTLIVVVLLAGAALLSQLTGVDLIGMISGTPSAPEVVATPDINLQTGPTSLESIQVSKGFGAAKGFWQVYFNVAQGSDRSTYSNGIDIVLAAAIDQVQSTLDIAAFEWNNPALNAAVLRARQRGVQVRMVADNEHTIDDTDSLIAQIAAAGIPIIYDQDPDLMHNKFMIMDRVLVWTGSMNYTVNGVYRNNNNIVMLRSPRVAQVFTVEFEEMFVSKQFGGKRAPVNELTFSQDGTPVQVLFAPEGDTITTIAGVVSSARTSVKFMAFSFTEDIIGDAMLARARANVSVEGVFETIGAGTEFSEMTRLKCAGLDVRLDGNPYRLHHKVIIVDDETVIFGSYNFSAGAASSNDENLVIITDRDFAAQYVAEYNRLRRIATAPTVTC
jgi:phosphatidylserine/phosphatidylglycerophosphate/cardiolipin synthase-like enzyme